MVIAGPILPQYIMKRESAPLRTLADSRRVSEVQLEILPLGTPTTPINNLKQLKSIRK